MSHDCADAKKLPYFGGTLNLTQESDCLGFVLPGSSSPAKIAVTKGQDIIHGRKATSAMVSISWRDDTKKHYNVYFGIAGFELSQRGWFVTDELKLCQLPCEARMPGDVFEFRIEAVYPEAEQPDVRLI